MSNAKRTKVSGAGLPRVIEFSADATGVGKTTAAWRLRHHCDRHGVKTMMVTIESRGVTHSQAHRQQDVIIATEDFKRAAELPGGLAGVLQPLYDTIEKAAETDSVVIVDWAGGQAQARLEALAATQFDERLAELDLVGMAVIVTSCAVEKMVQASNNMLRTREVAPGLQRALLLNERWGDFKFIHGSAAAAAYKSLMKTAQDSSIIRFPSIAGESWQECQQAGLTMPQVINSKPSEIAAKTGMNRFTAAACRNEVAAWFIRTETSLNQVLPFRTPASAA
jgi:hypothetical protein